MYWNLVKSTTRFQLRKLIKIRPSLGLENFYSCLRTGSLTVSSFARVASEVTPARNSRLPRSRETRIRAKFYCSGYTLSNTLKKWTYTRPEISRYSANPVNLKIPSRSLYSTPVFWLDCKLIGNPMKICQNPHVYKKVTKFPEKKTKQRLAKHHFDFD